MASINESLNALMECDGAMGACIVDYQTGMILGKTGGGVDLDLAGAGNSKVVNAKMETMKSLGIKGEIEDMLITLTDQLHIIRPTTSHPGLFIYLVLDKSRSNLALARRKVIAVEVEIEV